MALPDIQNHLTETIAAVAALGTAAMGLVDATKTAGWWGIGRAGFKHVERTLAKFETLLAQAAGPDWKLILQANWENGRPTGEQKAVVKALLRAGLTVETAASFAAPAGLDAAVFRQALQQLEAGADLSPQQQNVLARLDAYIESHLDAGFEKAERGYKNTARFVALLWSEILAVAAGRIIYPATDYWHWSGNLASALLVGLVAVPLAPIAKDLTSALGAATRAVKISRG